MVNENLLTKTFKFNLNTKYRTILYKWHGRVRQKCFTSFSLYAGIPLELLELVIQTFYFLKSGIIQLHFKRLGNQQETKYTGAIIFFLFFFINFTFFFLIILQNN